MKTLSNFFNFNSFTNLKNPFTPECFLLSSLSRYIISSTISLLLKYISTLVFFFAKIVTGVLNFLEIASINGRNIIMSPIPILFCKINIFIN